MTDEMIALARRAVACEGWRWMPGMFAWAATHPIVQQRGGAKELPVRFVAGLDTSYVEVADPKVIEAHNGNVLFSSGHAAASGYYEAKNILPDLSDPATLGCLLALVRAARGDPSYRPWSVEHDSGVVEWVIEAPSATRQTLYSTEAAALVAALAKGETR